MSETIDIKNTEPGEAGLIALRLIEGEDSSTPNIEAPTATIDAAEFEKDLSEHEKFLKTNYGEAVQELLDQDETLAKLLQEASLEELANFIKYGGEIANGYVLTKFVEAVELLGSPNEDDKYQGGYKALESMDINADATDPALHGIYQELQTGQIGFDDAAAMLYAIPEIKVYADMLNDPNTAATDMTRAFVDAYKRAYRDYGTLKDDKIHYEASRS